jgi:tetratricopeptide (TPR) repeat protein
VSTGKGSGSLEAALALHQQGNLAAALAAYAAVVAASPRNDEALHLYAIAALQAGDGALSTDLAGRAVDVDATNPTYRWTLGRALQRAGRLADAVESFRAAITLKPDYVAAHLSLGLALLGLDRAEEALASFDKAIALKPDSVEAHLNRGVACRRLGRADAALASFDKAIAMKPALAGAHSNRGNALQDLGRLPEAIASFERALALDPRHADARFNLGNACRALGRLDEAVAAYEAVIAAVPGHVGARSNLGAVLLALGQPEAALAALQTAIQLDGASAEARYNIGCVLNRLGRTEEAVASFDAALALRPGYAEAAMNRGVALADAGRHEEAVTSFDRALELRPDYVEAHDNRGAALRELGRLDEALAAHERALAIRPDADGHAHVAVALQKLGRLDEALAAYDQALALDPRHADALYNRGIALRDAGRYREAVTAFETAIAARPNNEAVHNSWGAMLHGLNRYPEAVDHYDRAIALSSNSGEAWWNKALALLTLGDFAAGWPLYEWRFRKSKLRTTHRDYGCPRWDGSQPLDGKTILLHGEQGLGDSIQFCRYAALVAARGGRVVLEIDKPLMALFAPLEGVSEIIESDAPLPVIDFHCPLMSLPMAFGTEIDSIPAAPSYLVAEERKIAAWQARLGERVRPRVGLVWSGNPQHQNDRNRSLSLARLLEHLPDGGNYVSLQKELRGEDRDILDRDGRVRFVGDGLTDFTETAALSRLMDVVVSVDTSVAHLAGALGVPVLLLVPFAPDWRWMLDRVDSPWYPSFRLLRQREPGDWSWPLDEVARSVGRLTT